MRLYGCSAGIEARSFSSATSKRFSLLQIHSALLRMRNKAEWICNKLKRLDVAEEKLRASIPALQPYNLIISHSPEETE